MLQRPGVSSSQRGFTLIEALVALGIAATALVVLMGRLGSSADIQRSLSLHERLLDAASNKLAEQVANRESGDDRDGVIEAGELRMVWRSWTERTELDGFVRRNVAVKVADEPEVSLFIYQDLKH